MLQFQMPNITREQLANNRARFEVEPLDRGFGHTFGNALRRVLLSTLEGAAVSAVKIEVSPTSSLRSPASKKTSPTSFCILRTWSAVCTARSTRCR